MKNYFYFIVVPDWHLTHTHQTHFSLDKLSVMVLDYDLNTDQRDVINVMGQVYNPQFQTTGADHSSDCPCKNAIAN